MPCFKSVPARAARARPRSASPNFPMRPHARLQSCPHRVVTRAQLLASEVMEPVQLGPACVRSAHRHSLEDAPVRLSQTDRPPSSRHRAPVRRRRPLPGARALPGRAPHVARSPAACPSRPAEPARPPPRTSGETVAESALPLRADLDAFRRPSVVRASENEKGPPPAGHRSDGVEGVPQRRASESCSLLRTARWAEACLGETRAGALAMTITAGVIAGRPMAPTVRIGPLTDSCDLRARRFVRISRMRKDTGNPSRLSLGLYPHLRESAPHPSLYRSWWETQLIGDLRVG